MPLGLIGVLWMLFLTGTTLNVQSSMGVIFMVGIVVANSVLLVDFANKQRRLGASVHKAITTAAAAFFFLPRRCPLRCLSQITCLS